MELLSHVYDGQDSDEEPPTQRSFYTKDEEENTSHKEHPPKKITTIDVRKYLHTTEDGNEERQATTPAKRPRKDTSGVELVQMLPPPKRMAPVKDTRIPKSVSSTRNEHKESNAKEQAIWSNEESVSQPMENNVPQPVTPTQEQLWHSVPSSHQLWKGMEDDDGVAKEFLRDMNKYGSDIKMVHVQFSDLVDTSKPDETFVTRQSASTSEVVSKLARVAGKVTRIQKERHQLNAVAADLAAKQVELEEKRSKSRQTKSETWAKYGW